MKKIPLVSAGTILMVFLCTASAFEKDTFDVDLDPAAWSSAPDVQAVKEGNLLLLRGTDNGGWATPRANWPAARSLDLGVEASPEGGSLIVQAEWFDRSGTLVSAAEVLRITGSSIRAHGAPLEAPEGATSFGLKFWMEGSPAKASIAGLTITRTPDWSTSAKTMHRVAPDNTRVRTDAGLSYESSGSDWKLMLQEGTPYAGAHLDNPVDVHPGLRVLLPVMELPHGAAVSVQIMKWDRVGTFLGEIEALKDITEVGDYEFALPSEWDDPRPSRITAKIWISAPPERPVRLGVIRFTCSDGTP